MEILVLLFAGGWALLAVVGYAIGQPKNQGAAGALAGLFLGPLGWLLAFMLPDQNPKCPACFTRINPSAHTCWRCGLNFEANRQAWTAHHAQANAVRTPPPLPRGLTPLTPHAPTAILPIK